MKAVVRRRYGGPDVLDLAEIEKPMPSDGEVLIRVHAASVNALDRHFMRGEPLLARLMMGLRHPKEIRLGVDVAGEVKAVGANVREVCRRALAPAGRYVMVGAGRLLVPIAGLLAAKLLHRKAGIVSAKNNLEDLATLAEFMATGKLKPVIDRRYALDEVPEAIRRLEEGRARGKIVIHLSP